MITRIMPPRQPPPLRARRSGTRISRQAVAQSRSAATVAIKVAGPRSTGSSTLVRVRAAGIGRNQEEGVLIMAQAHVPTEERFSGAAPEKEAGTTPAIAPVKQHERGISP